MKLIREDAGLAPPFAFYRHSRGAVGAGLFLLLAYCTSVAFVPATWAVASFQIGVYALVAVCLGVAIRRHRERLAGGWIPWLVYAIPVWGVIQMLAHTTASVAETREATLRWGALAGVFFLTQIAARSTASRGRLLDAFLAFATVMAVLCITQLFTSEGRVLWMFPSGYPDVYATFPSYNHFAQLMELALPIALWRALREGWKSWWSVLVAGILYGSVIGSASRTGTVLCTLEVIAVLIIGWLRRRELEKGIVPRSTIALMVLVPVLAGAFTMVVGWERVWGRFQLNDTYLVRGEFLRAAADMAGHRPLTGYGLGTFPEVYQRYAIRDLPFYANHAHNDWAEFAADGGIPFFLLVTIPFAAIIPSAIRHPWGLGLLAVMLHACVDFPFPRAAVSCWMFAMLGMLYMAQWQKISHPLVMPPVSEREFTGGQTA